MLKNYITKNVGQFRYVEFTCNYANYLVWGGENGIIQVMCSAQKEYLPLDSFIKGLSEIFSAQDKTILIYVNMKEPQALGKQPSCSLLEDITKIRKIIHRFSVVEKVNLSFFFFIEAGLFIDKGVKITNASATDKREYLSLDTNAR